MTTFFQDLMDGLDEVDVFLAGEAIGYKVNPPAAVDVRGIREGLKVTQVRRRNSK